MIRGSAPYNLTKRTAVILWIAVLSSPAALFGQDFCGFNDPARPVPKCVANELYCPSNDPNCSLADPDCAICIEEVCDGPGAPTCCISENNPCTGNVCSPICSPATYPGTGIPCNNPEGSPARLWPQPDGAWQPTDTPGQPLPADRDSTDWRSFTLPRQASGHELFMSLDIAGDHLYVVYNAGVQVWNIGGNNADDPQKREGRDGWLHHFFTFSPPGEADFFVDDVAALVPPGNPNKPLVAVSGKPSVGLSLWEHTISPSDLVQLYQDPDTDSRQVRLATHTNGQIYAITGGLTGVFVYNATSAVNFPCDDVNPNCGTVSRGELGAMTSGGYLDVIERNNTIYVVASDGDGLPSRPLSVEIWELGNPEFPTSGQLLFGGQGINSDVRGPELFEIDGTYYLAFIERSGPNQVLKVFNVDNCLDGNGCGSLGSPVWSTNLPDWSTTHQYLSFSESDGVPFLYYGFNSSNMSGTKVEQLYDLTELPPGGPNPQEITTGGGTYFDLCSNKSVDYWGHYYEKNEFGLNNASPRVGKFKGGYFYRAAVGLLDVHVRETEFVPEDPVITTTVVDPAPHYMNHPISFSATAENCPGAPSWSWLDDDVFASDIDANGSSAEITFSLCAGTDCPNRTIEVWALNAACSGDPNLQENRAMVTVREPRPHIRDIEVCPENDPGCPQVLDPEFEVCTVLRFEADVDGRPLINHLWEVRDAENELIETSTDEVFIWDTTGISLDPPPPPPPEIFSDGFETGNTREWSLDVGEGEKTRTAETTESRPVDILALVAKGGGSADFNITLAVSNADGADAGGPPTVTLVGLGDLGFGNPAITVVDDGEASYSFQANTESATEWRWEFEDPENGSPVGCLVYANCAIYDWGQDDDQVTYQWTTPNEDGLYGVTVSIRNCVEMDDPLSEEIDVNVTGIVDPDPPEITGFTIDDPACTRVLSTYTCPVNHPINFEVTSQGGAQIYEFDWDDDGTFDQQIPAGNPTVHTYTMITTVRPDVRAIAGMEVSPAVPLDGSIILE